MDSLVVFVLEVLSFSVVVLTVDVDRVELIIVVVDGPIHVHALMVIDLRVQRLKLRVVVFTIKEGLVIDDGQHVQDVVNYEMLDVAEVVADYGMGVVKGDFKDVIRVMRVL